MSNVGSDLPRIVVDTPAAAPTWAVLQRQLVRALIDAAPEFVARFAHDDGTLRWRDRWPGMDGSDDPYEAFMYLALLHSATGDDQALALARRMWEGITWQWTQYGTISREFDRYYDWLHHGEANLFHYFFGLTDPSSLRDRQRAQNFARMYDGSDPIADNYDSELGIIRAPQTGSDGPRFVVTEEDLSTHRGVLDDYHPPFEDLSTSPFPSVTTDWSDDAVFTEIIRFMNARTTRGDVPLNLNATTQMAHEFLYSGDGRRRDWVVRYLDSWKRRADENGGIVPDNVGLSGRVGEYLDGKWWGGHYGWRWPHGWLTIIEPILNASLNALLLTGDCDRSLALVRQQLDENFALGRQVDGEMVFPHKHFDSGWTDYRSGDPFHAIHLWARSLEPQDRDRVERLSRTSVWSEVKIPRVPFLHKHYNVNTLPWYEFVTGALPDYPEQALRANLELIEQQLDRMRSPEGEPSAWSNARHIAGHTESRSLQTDGYAIHVWQEFCPIYFESLIQLSWGAPMHTSHGGLQHAALRPFDPARRRPGLPDSVAILVHTMEQHRVALDIANLDEHATHRVILQAGAFGEHRWTSVGGATPTEQFDSRWVEIELAPGTADTIELGVARYVAAPSYETPWSGRRDWSPLIIGRFDDGA